MSLSLNRTGATGVLPGVVAAKAALNNFRRQNYDLSPDNEAHLQAYLTLRDTVARITPEKLITYLQTLEQKVAHGEENKCEFWAVPRVNFPDGLPQHIAAAHVPAERSKNNRFPLEHFFHIDQVICRRELGMNVWTTGTFLKTSNVGIVATGPACLADVPGLAPPSALALTDGGAAGGGPATGGGRARWGALQATGGGGAAGGGAAFGGSATGVAATGDRSLKRERSLAGEEPPSPESAALKKARTEREALQLLKANTVAAEKAGKWVHNEGSISPNSVVHWVGRTVIALEELSKDQRDVANAIQKVCFKYAAFIVKLLMRSPCYPDVIRFKGLLPRLVAICGDEIDGTTCDECKLLEQLAGIAECSDDRLKDDVCKSVFVMTTFQQCPCYLSFVHNRGKRALKRAHAADTDAERLTILEPMRDPGGMPQELLTSIETAVILCQSGTPKEEIAEFIFSNQPQAAQMAEHWHPTTAVGAIGRLVQEKLPEFGGVSYEGVCSGLSRNHSGRHPGSVAEPVGQASDRLRRRRQTPATGVHGTLCVRTARPHWH
jgi:hypothetical protein